MTSKSNDDNNSIDSHKKTAVTRRRIVRCRMAIATIVTSREDGNNEKAHTMSNGNRDDTLLGDVSGNEKKACEAATTIILLQEEGLWLLF